MREFVKAKLCVTEKLFDTLWNRSKDVANLFRTANKIAHRNGYVLVIWNSICWEDSKAISQLFDILDELDIESMKEGVFDYVDKEQLPTWSYQLDALPPVVKSSNNKDTGDMLEILEEFSKGSDVL